MESDENTMAEQLRSAGLRVTSPRLAVLAAVQGIGHHRDVLEIVEIARKRLGALSVQSVYDNLDVLVESGLVHRIQLSGQPARYEVRVGDNHHHIVCRRCGVTADVDCAVGNAPCLEPSNNPGFLVEKAEVIYWGICPQCQLELSPNN